MCPIYEYRCQAGHRTEIFQRMAEEHPPSVQCASCPKPALRVFSPAAVREDFPSHWNWSLGCLVKNRAHHERLQRELNLQDWVPVKESPQLSKLRKQGYTI